MYNLKQHFVEQISSLLTAHPHMPWGRFHRPWLHECLRMTSYSPSKHVKGNVDIHNHVVIIVPIVKFSYIHVYVIGVWLALESFLLYVTS